MKKRIDSLLEHVEDLVQVVLVKVADERPERPVAPILADAVAKIRVTANIITKKAVTSKPKFRNPSQ